MKALNIKLIRDLWRMRAQAFAIVLVTAAGALAFVTLIGTLRSLDETQRAYYEKYQFADIFSNVRRAPNYIAHELALIPGVRKVTTRIMHNAVLDIAGMDEPLNGLILSAPKPGEDALNNVHIRKGRMVRPGIDSEVVLNEAFAQANKLKLGSTFYATIKGSKRQLTVIGIGLSPEYIFFGVPGTVVPDDRRFGVMWMDREAEAAAFDLRGAFNDVVLAAMPGANQKDIVGRVDRLLAPFGGIGAYTRDDHVSHATLTGNIEQLRSMILIAAPVFLGVVAFLLHMLMMRHIETEREHIGVLKAFGYSNVAIAWHYMKLVLTIVAVGVIIGLIGGSRLGRAVTEIYSASYHFPFLKYSLTIDVFLKATAIQLGSAFLGGMGSLRKAIVLSPAVAMRPPPPPVYKRTVLEQIGLRLFGDQPTRMILRHIFRWPLRSALTVLGIALATSLLVAPMLVLDSAKHMIRTHFFRAERQDMTVALAQVRPKVGSMLAIANEPGVLQLEPFRASLVNVSFKGKQRRLTVLGRPSINELSRPLIASEDPLIISNTGIVISNLLAEWLGANKGDYLDMQFVESRRPFVRLPITDIALSHVGMTFFIIYMELNKLNHLMGDGDVISGVHARTDKQYRGQLYSSIKAVPAITGMVSQTAQLNAMQRIMEQTTKMTLLNIIFAAIIVFGVVYNSARISLSERSRELATMRMLGFTRTEASYILIGELALLAALAIPIGCAMGYALAWQLTEGTDNEMFRLPLHMQKASFGYSILSVIVTVMLSSGVVTRRIFNLDLLDILKTRE